MVLIISLHDKDGFLTPRFGIAGKGKKLKDSPALDSHIHILFNC